MERQSIYLESGEEITSAVDKLKNAESSILDIVIPKEALMLQSVVNLKLLKRQAESLGKEITIVTQDKVGTKLAEQIGIPVVAKEGDVPKEMKVKEGEAEPKPTEEDIEFKDKEEVEAPAKKSKVEPGVVEETKEVVDESKKVKPKTGKEKLKGMAWVKAHWKGVLVASGFGVLVLAMAAYIYVPLSRINISLAAQKESVDITFVADANADGVNTESYTIPAEKIEESLEESEEFSATGEKDVGEKSTGKAKVCNSEDSDAFTLNAGTKLLSDDLTYKTVSNIQVPGASVDGGEIVEECSAAVSIQAVDVGPSYNNDAAGVEFTIPALTGSYSAESTTALSGGTSEVVKYVTSQDIANAKESLEKSVETELKNKINDGLDGKQLLEDAMEVEQKSAKASVSAGAEVEKFSYTVEATGTAIVFSQDDLLVLAEQVLAAKIGSGREIVEKESLVSEADFTKADFSKGTMNATLAGEAYIASKVDEEEVKIQIAGVPEAEALSYLSEIDGVQSVEISFFPNFYKRIARVKSHIYLKIEISKLQTQDTSTE